MVSNPLKAKKYLSGEREKINKWLRWLHMIKHEKKNWRGSKVKNLYSLVPSPKIILLQKELVPNIF
jgi:hypothetical protein